MKTLQKHLSNETKAMAELAIKLLKIDERYSISLLLNYSPILSNQTAVAFWISDYIESHPHNADFRNGVMPSLQRELSIYENRDW
jgi:hypothetical protein